MNFKTNVIPAIVFQLLTSAMTFGQSSSQLGPNGLLPRVIPASPEASSLGLYGEWPVSLYTGTANISIPVYNIKVRGVEIPIQLSYHGGGVKIDEVSSRVGTGWALNAGGMISRTVVGLPDEQDRGFLTRNLNAEYLPASFNLPTSPANYVFFRRVTASDIDTEPDIFYFNFGGMSGKFYFDQGGQFRCIPANSLKLISSPVRSLSPLIEWKVADQNGTVYCFGSPVDDWLDAEANGLEATFTNLSNSPVPEAPLAVTAWYLTKVISPSKADTVFFDYIQKVERYLLPATQARKVLLNPGSLSSPSASGDPWETVLNAHAVTYNGSPTSSQVLRWSNVSGISDLKKIRWKEGEIEFFRKTQRQDMTAGYMLDSIIVMGKDQQLRRYFQLKYNYISGRYYLDSLNEGGSDLKKVRGHAFSYIQPGTLPQRGANSQDHWGYYNGRSDNTTLLPEHLGVFIGLTNANREPHGEYMQYGTLAKITYPTGGFSNFEYESHEYVADGTAGGGPPAPLITRDVNHAGSTVVPYARTTSFSVPFQQQLSYFRILIENYAFQPNVNNLNVTWFPYVKIERQTTSGYTQVYYWDPSHPVPGHPTPGNLTPNQHGLYDFSFYPSSPVFTEGNYRITISDSCLSFGCFDELPIMPRASIGISYKDYDTTSGNNLPRAGGLRIKKISSYTEGNNFAGAKSYDYSPGKLLAYPSYIHQYETDVWDMTAAPGSQLCMTMIASFKELTSTSQTILGLTQGASVGYSSVTERSIDASGVDNGYTNYNYSYTGDSLSTYNFDPYWSFDIINSTVPSTGFDYKRGLLRGKTEYKRNQTGAYVKVKAMENEYSFNDYNLSRHYNRHRALRVKRLRFVDYPCGTTLDGYMIPPSSGTYEFKKDFGYAFYDVISGWVEQKLVRDTVYDENGTNPVVNITSYSYDNPALLNPTRLTTINSKGDTIVNHTAYPQDYASGTAFIDAMIANNITGVPIENVRYKSDLSGNVTVLDGSITVFKPDGKGLVDEIRLLSAATVPLSGFKFSNTSAGILPHRTTTRSQFSSDSRYVSREKVLKYDLAGNVLQQQRTDDVMHSYLWGYNNAYPIAEIIGVDYNTAVSFVDTAILRAPQSDQQLRNELNKIRNGLNGSTVKITTYTYKPLVGMTSSTDVSGLTVFYEYDALGRLKIIKDQYGNILKQTDYRYRVAE